MADNSPLKIYAVPRCVAAPAGQAELRGQLIEIDRMADGGQSDGFITAGNFDSLKNKFPDLKRFQSFGDFKGYIEQYTASQQCTPACKEESKLQNQLPHPELGEPICIAPPAPEPPPMPKPKKRKPKPNIPEFETGYPKWFDKVPPLALAKRNQVQPKHIPSVEETIAAQWSLDFLGPNVGDDIDTSRPGVTARFNGTHFILSVYGCHMDSTEERNCVADWPFVIIIVQNLSSDDTQSKKADSRGRVSIRIKATPGDSISFAGRDPYTKRYSLQKKFLRVNPDGSVVLEKAVDIYSDGRERKESSGEEVRRWR